MIRLLYRPATCHSSRWGLRAQRWASASSAGSSLEVFDDNIKQLQRERSAANFEASRNVDYLRDEIALRLCERLLVRSAPNLMSVTMTNL